MYIPTRCFGVILLAGCLLQPGCATDNSAATSDASEFTRTPAVNPDMEAGRREARRDLVAGKLVYQLMMAESVLRSILFEDDPSDPLGVNKYLLDYYEALLADRYSIEHRLVMYHAGTPVEERCRVAGYDEVMMEAIQQRFGANVVDLVWKQACATPASKRAEYLKARRGAADRRYPASTRSADHQP